MLDATWIKHHELRTEEELSLVYPGFLSEVAARAALIILAIFSLLENFPSPVAGKQGGGGKLGKRW